MWTRLSRRGIMGAQPRFQYTSNCITLPPHIFRATVKYINNNIVQMTGWQEHFFHEDLLFQLESEEDWILSAIDRDVNLNARLALEIHRNNVQVVPDGSFYKEHQAGGAGWYIESLDSSTMTSSGCITPGPATAQSSARSELMGILGSIMHCNYICKCFDITSGFIKLFCNNEGSVKALQQKHTVIKNSRKNFDIHQSLHYVIKASPITWEFHHIRAHQDDVIDFECLSCTHQLNVLADLKAKETVIQAIENQTFHLFCTYSLPHLKCEIRLGSGRNQHQQVCSNLLKTVKHHCASSHIRSYWIQKHHLLHQAKHVDWELKSKSHSNLSKSTNRWLSKHSTGFCGVGKMLV